MTGFVKTHEALVIIFLIGAAFLLRLPFVGDELLPEEATNIRAGSAIVQTGFPIIYQQEIKPRFVHLQHPPMLFAILAASFKLLGESDIVARLTMLVFGVLYVFLTYLFCRYAFRAEDEYWVRFLAPALLLVNPYTVQMSIDIAWEGGVLTFFVTLWMLLCYVCLVRTSSPTRLGVLAVGIAFYLLLWTKIETSLILLFALSVFFLVRRDWKRIGILYATIGVAMVLFLLSLYTYVAAFGHPEAFWIPLDFALPFEQILAVLHPMKDPLTAVDSASTIYQPPRTLYVLSFVLWITLAFAILVWLTFIQGILRSIYRPRRAVASSLHLYLWLWAVSFVVVYVGYGWAGAYPRYFVPSMPPLAILTAVLVNRTLLVQPRRVKYYAVSGVLVISAYVGLRIAGFLDRSLIYSNRNPTETGFLVVILALLLLGVFFIFSLRLRSNTLRQSIVVILVGFYLLSAAHFWLHDLVTPNSVRSTFGQYGYRQAGLYLRDRIDPERDVLFTLDNIAYYAGAQHYYSQWIVGPYPSVQQQLLANLRDGQVHFAYVALPASWLGNASRTGTDPVLKFLLERARDPIDFGTIRVFAVQNSQEDSESLP